MDSRSTFFGVFNNFSSRNFDDDYDLQRKCLARGDLCEIRQCIEKKTNEIRTVKIYRKSDLGEDLIHLVKNEI
jgi:hypothetical protein